jgi:putative transposase
MENFKDIRTGRHCVFLMHIHLVFITKYRRKAFTKEVIDFMKPIFEKVCNDFEAELIECDGESDHIHLLVNYPPKVSVSKLVNSLKGVSSRKVRQQKFKSVDSKLWGKSLWSPSYFAGSCGGASLDVVKKYIEQQETPS